MSDPRAIAERARRIRGSGPPQVKERSYAEPVRQEPGVWLAKITGHDSDTRLYAVAEVADTSADKESTLVLALKDNGRTGWATNLCELGVAHELGGDAFGFGGIVDTPGAITAPDRYVVIHEINAGVGKRLVFDSYPGQLVALYAYRVTGVDASGCPCGGWYRVIGPSFQEANPTIPACP